MIDIDVAEPVEHNGMEWLSVKIHGQSFMLHQIVSSGFFPRSSGNMSHLLRPAAKDDKYGGPRGTNQDSRIPHSQNIR